MSDVRLTPERPPGPSTAHLPWEDRMRLAIEDARGSFWRPWHDLWILRHPTGENAAVFYPDDASISWDKDVSPNPLRDPAAWGALVEKELCGLYREFDESGVWWRADWTDRPVGVATLCAPSPGEAAALAVLTKHSHSDLTALLESRPSSAYREE